MPTADPLAPELERIALNDWLAQLRRGIWLGLTLLAICVAGAIVYLHVATYRYAAILTVTPADQSGQKAGGNLANLGSLVGVDLSSQSGSAFSMYVEAVSSYPIAEVLSRDPALMHALFPNAWDAQTRQWHEPQSTLRSLSQFAKRLLGVPIVPWQPPAARDLKAYIEKSVVATEDKKKAFVRLSYENADPRIAALLLQRVNAAADEFLRTRSLARAKTYVDYLERRLAQIQVAEYRLSMAQVLGNYEKTRMMASSDASFAAETFGDIWVSPNFVSPNPWIVLLLAVTVAVVAWLALVILVLPAIASMRAGRSAVPPD